MTRRALYFGLSVIFVSSLIGIFLCGAHKLPYWLVFLFGGSAIALAWMDFSIQGGKPGD